MTSSVPNTFTFAACPYANAMPLVHFLSSADVRATVVFDHPSALAAMLLDGRADAALIPVIDLFDHPFRRIEGLGVCAEDNVQSVLIHCYRPMKQVRVVAMDAASHTSNALAAILLRERFGLSPRMGCAEGEEPDAAVVIGDRALCLPPGPCGNYDLAAEWKALTGLPFVFAVWAIRADHPRAAELARIAHQAKQAGMAALDELARRMAARLPLGEERCRTYLRSAIHYDVGARELAAIELFRQRVLAGKLLPRREYIGKGHPLSPGATAAESRRDEAAVASHNKKERL